MTNRTREFFDFANNEPVAVEDMTLQLREMTQEEIDHIECVIENIGTAINEIDGTEDTSTEWNFRKELNL